MYLHYPTPPQVFDILFENILAGGWDGTRPRLYTDPLTALKYSDISNRKQKQMAWYFKSENYFCPPSFLLKEIFVSYTESKVQKTLEALIYTCHFSWI